MTETLLTLIFALAVIAVTVIFLFFPSILELKKPKDAGPRVLTDSLAQKGLSDILSSPILKMKQNLFCH